MIPRVPRTGRSPAARRARPLAVLFCGLALAGCDAPPCGPARAQVTRVLDGDTIELAGGELVRYLLVDAPELSRGDCFAREALTDNRALVLGRQVTLAYDVQCRDAYERLLAYVTVEDEAGAVDVNRALIERGAACVLHIPPNGAERLGELTAAQARARAEQRGLWAACPRKRCR